MSAEELKKELDEDKKFYRQMLKESIDISKVNAESQKETNRLLQELTMNISEFKLAMQTKPCIAEKKEEKINEGWKDSIVKSYQYIIAALFTLIVGILTAFGLYSPKP